MTLRAKLFHPATAIALLALVVAAGGTSWATRSSARRTCGPAP